MNEVGNTYTNEDGQVFEVIDIKITKLNDGFTLKEIISKMIAENPT